MAEAVLVKISYVAGAILVYGLLRLRLIYATHNFRVRVAIKADELALDLRLTEKTRGSLVAAANRGYAAIDPWLYAFGITVAVFFPFFGSNPEPRSKNPDLNHRVIRLQAQQFFAAVSTSPAALLWCVFVMLSGLLIYKSVATIIDYAAGSGFGDGSGVGAGTTHATAHQYG